MSNPYGSPTDTIHTNPVYYRTEITGASFSEIRNIAPNMLACLVGFTVKVLRLKLKPVVGFAHDELIYCPVAEVPKDVQEGLGLELSELSDASFVSQFAMSVPVIGNATAYSIVGLSGDGRTWSSALYTKVTGAEKTTLTVGTALSSKIATGIATGDYYSTANISSHLIPPPGFHATYQIGESVTGLLATHSKVISELPGCDCISPEELPSIIHEMSLRTNSFHRERGVFVPMTVSEVLALSN